MRLECTEMRASERICKATILCVAAVMSVFGTIGTACRLMRITGGEKTAEAGAVLAQQNTDNTTDFDKASESSLSSRKPVKDPFEEDTDLEISLDTPPDDTDHTGENTYLVTESLYRESNMSCENFYVKNATDLSIDLKQCLNAELPFKYENTSRPQVLIVHTHATESYMDSDLGYYYESFYPRSTDDSRNVVRVGDQICDSLKKDGIESVHCTVHHDDPSYLGAYDNCADSINEYLARYPSIKIILDIHRDSITTDDNEKIKPTFTYNGKKAAQIMIMCGNDNYGYYDFPDWQDNLNLAVKLQKAAETNYPGMTRPLHFGNFMYNMNLAPGSLLIEIGTDANTLEESVRSGEYLGHVISGVLKETEK